MYAEITARTLEFAVSGVSPIKYELVYNEVVGLRVTYAYEEVTSLTVLTIDGETKRLVPIAFRIDLREIWPQWLRDLVEDHRVLEAHDVH